MFFPALVVNNKTNFSYSWRLVSFTKSLCRNLALFLILPQISKKERGKKSKRKKRTYKMGLNVHYLLIIYFFSVSESHKHCVIEETSSAAVFKWKYQILMMDFLVRVFPVCSKKLPSLLSSFPSVYTSS